MEKVFINPITFREDGFALGAQMLDDGFEADFLLILLRGGAEIGCFVDEYLGYFGVNTGLIFMRTSSYDDIDKTSGNVIISDVGDLIKDLKSTSKVAIIDDIFDTGLSIEAVLNFLQESLKENCPKDIRIATVDYKPTRNLTKRVPNYYVNAVKEWLVYPHELKGLTIDEIRQGMGSKIANLIETTMNNRNLMNSTNSEK